MNIDVLNQHAGKALVDMGCSSNYIGYFFLKEGLAQILYNGFSREYVGKALYKDIAERFYTLPCEVERSIKTFINHSWKQLAQANIFKVKPSSEEFFETCAMHIRIIFQDELGRMKSQDKRNHEAT